MTYRSPHIRRPWIAIPVLVLLVLAVAGYVFEADSRTEQPTRVLVVVDTAGRQDARLVERATAALRQAERAGAEAELRVTRTPTQQLSVTHYFAAKRYDAIVGVNLDRAIAVAPVEAEYPDTRFALVAAPALATAAEAAAAR
jgi:basic membrane lipoprotein Med (substrate-binding protein (PBP1-ABC) superfamily)